MKAGMVAVALLGMLASGGAIADGNELLADCQKALKNKDEGRSGSMGDGYCLGLINGVGSTMDALSPQLKPNPLLKKTGETCMPALSNGQSARIVTKYLQDHPASLHLGAAYLTMLALQDAYPCK